MPSPRQPGLPYAHLNLRWNPFRELPLAEWAQVALVDTAPFVEQLAESGTVLQFIGEKGCGKTTHLLAIRACFATSGYVHIPEGERRPVPPGTPVLIDEAQRLTIRQRYQVFRTPIPLVLGTHRDFQRALQRAGRRVRTIRVADQTTPTRVHRMIHARIEAARRQPGKLPDVSLATVEQLMLKHGPNIRAIVHSLYDAFQTLSSIDRI